MYKELVTIQSVSVDSVVNTTWVSHKGGIYNIEDAQNGAGVNITWLQGRTFVPWGNIRYLRA